MAPKRPAAKRPGEHYPSKGTGKGGRRGGSHYARKSWAARSAEAFQPGSPNFNPANQKIVLLIARHPSVSHSWMVEFLKKNPKNRGISHKKIHEIHSAMYSVSSFHPEVTAEIKKLMRAEISRKDNKLLAEFQKFLKKKRLEKLAKKKKKSEKRRK